MTPEQRAHFEQRLRNERERLLALIRAADDEASEGSPTRRAGDLSEVPLHNADRGSDEMQREVDGILGDGQRATLEEIDAALERLYRTPDTFGIDERTGAPIPLARLELVPWARVGVARQPLGRDGAHSTHQSHRPLGG